MERSYPTACTLLDGARARSPAGWLNGSPGSLEALDGPPRARRRGSAHGTCQRVPRCAIDFSEGLASGRSARWSLGMSSRRQDDQEAQRRSRSSPSRPAVGATTDRRRGGHPGHDQGPGQPGFRNIIFMAEPGLQTQGQIQGHHSTALTPTVMFPIYPHGRHAHGGRGRGDEEEAEQLHTDLPPQQLAFFTKLRSSSHREVPEGTAPPCRRTYPRSPGSWTGACGVPGVVGIEIGFRV